MTATSTPSGAPAAPEAPLDPPAVADAGGGADRRAVDRRSVAIVFALGCAFSAPAIVNGFYHPDRWTGPVDFPAHLEGAERAFRHPWEPGIPHFLLHLAARLVAAGLPGVDVRLAMTALTIATCGAFCALLYVLLARAVDPGPRWVAAVLALAIAFADSPSSLGGWSQQLPPDFYLSLSNPNSQTHLASHVFGLGLLVLVARVLEQPERRDVRWLLPFAVVATLLKPNLSPVIAAVALAYSYLRRHDDGGGERLQIVWQRLFVPVGAIVVYQAYILRFETPRILPEYGTRGLSFAPLRDLVTIGGDRPVFWGVALFPVVAALLFGRSLRSPLVLLASACLAVQLVLALTFGIDGELYGADFWWTAHIGFLVVTVTVIIRIAELVGSDPTRWRGRAALAALAFVPSVVGGVALWTCQGTGACLVR